MKTSSSGSGIFANHHIRDSDPAGRDPHPEFGNRLKAREFLRRPNQMAIRPAHSHASFSHVSLQYFAIDEIAVGVIAGAQVFVHRDQRADAHGFII